MTNTPNMTEIEISRMTEDDMPEVLAIEITSFTMPWSEALFLNEVRNPLSRPVAARIDGTIAGYLCSSLVLDEGHILDVAVHPARRRQGIGRRLIHETLNHLVRQGCRMVFLEVRASHAGVIGFYEQAGFRVIQTRKCYYVSPIDDAAIMELRFPEHGHAGQKQEKVDNYQLQGKGEKA